MKNLTVMIIAGEISGDIHASNLLRELRMLHPSITAYGIGGDALEKEGMELIYHTRDMAVMGISEVLQKIRFFRGVLKEMKQLAAERRPDLLLTVDYPGFNIRLAEQVHAMGIKTVQYISPKVWAWNARRIPRIAAAYDRLITILPFAAESYNESGLDVVYAGNPLIDTAKFQLESPPTELPWKGSPHIALLPGSRRHEINRIIPVMLCSLNKIRETFPQCSSIIPAPTEEIADIVKRTLISHRDIYNEDIPVIVGEARNLLRNADAAVVASGTATLEASLMRCPMVITYRVSALSWILARLLVKVTFAGLVNLIANRRVCTELLQKDATAENICRELTPLLTDTKERRNMLKSIDEVNSIMGEPGASARAAKAISELF